MNYAETLCYIHSVSNYFCKPGLDRIKKLCAYLGNPQNSLKFIHVAGTNGKGSFCAMLSSILRESGYKVGTYTSPYILEFNERICINGKMISNDDLAEICSFVKPFAEKMEDKPTEFELITAIGFEYFKRQNCDIVVLECGLGGRYDATNLIDTPLLSVITGIGFDHENFLGDTIEKIALEKAGIIKSGVPCLWCGEDSIADTVIRKYALSVGSDIITPKIKEINNIKTDLSGTVFDYKDYKNLRLNVLGCYQVQNAANAVSAAEILHTKAFNITNENIRIGLANARWRARFEVLCKKPVIIFDGSHNPQGVSAAVKSIKKYFGTQKVNILTGVMKDKDYVFIANEVSSVANNVYCITPNNPRALSAKEFCDVFKHKGVSATHFDNISDAVNIAISDSEVNGTPLICMGSLYMYSDIHNLINY